MRRISQSAIELFGTSTHRPDSVNLRRLSAFVAIAICLTVTNADARTKRSQSAKVEFKYEHPCPATGARKGPCKGHVIDHINPLACGGPDTSTNMQWQTIAEGKTKDKWERNGCESKTKSVQNASNNSVCHVGPRGGTYTITRTGRKNYAGC